MALPKKGRGKTGNVPKQKFEEWVHAQVTDPIVWDHFVTMAKAHQSGRSAFVRWLIEREWARQGNGALTPPPDDMVLPNAEARQRNGAHWMGKRDDVFEFDEEHARKLLNEVKKGEGKK